MAVDCLALTAPLRRSFINVGRCSRNTLYLYGFVCLLLSSEFSYVSSQQNNTDLKYVCLSMDIRNSLDEFKKLENCTVIEGFLQVLLFDNVNHTELSKIQFPKLTEITDYLLMYRVNGLRSIGQLFPNLALIRGQNQFLNNAALTVFEMSSLQEIGLFSLTEISQGVVHIDKNPSLCFVHTIDWDRIIRERKGSFIKSLKPENECPVCPSMITQETSDGQSINSSCQIAPRTNSDGNGKDKYLCWNKHHCQKICPSNCTGGCNDKGECCLKSCITCSNQNPELCLVCKNLSMGDGKNKKCMNKCPDNYLSFLERRCITREECVTKDKPIEIHPTIEIDKPYKVFKDENITSCVLNCPNNYMASYEDHECKPCGGTCRKECDGINIDSITVVKTLRGCTHIKGPLEIQIRGGAKVVSELEENLSMIEEISGYLKIVRSFSLVSLNFFKSLKKIKGEIKDSNKYVFIVLDNQNLQELFSDNRVLQIGDGRLFFHFNPKLCFSKITSLHLQPKLGPPTELEVAKNSNGDKIACDVTKLNVTIIKILEKAVVLEWKKFPMEDMRKLLAYTVYCIEAPYRNITEYDRRDACGLDDWHVYDVTYQENENIINHLLPNLKPFTQYAFYVKTYTVASEPRGAKSDLLYFRTKPSTPSHPTHLRITSNSSDSLTITWGPPNQPNGRITHYVVSGRLRKYAYPYSKERNYCKDPPTVSIPPEDRFTITTPSPKSSNESCTCDEKENQRISIDESEELQRIKFEDELHNQVYQKRVSDMRRKRNADDLYSGDLNTITNLTTDKGTLQTFRFPVYGKTEFYINKLHHYTSYEVHVTACRQKEIDDQAETCSISSSHTLRTMQKTDADNIYRVQITNQSLDSVLVSWDQPEDPNGVILTYTIEYQRIDIDQSRVPYSSPHPLCINRTNDINRTVSYPITRLAPGNYSLRVMATSSANSGAYSPYVYFYIEKPTSNTVLIVCIIIFVALAIIIFSGWMYRKYLKKEKAKHRINLSINPEYIPSVYVPDEWEVSRDKIELIKELGQGSFGMVWEGIAKDIKGKSEIKCAVKTVNEHATNRERLEFLNEASVMKAFDTTHVVRLLGVVSQGQPTLVIMELMANGDLKSYLRSHRPDVENYDPNLKSPPTLRQILQMAIEIADGMAYLSAKKFVHRDLAARNCMVSEDLTVKIGDFGMTRDIYETDYYRKGTKGLLPVRWMAPESLKDGVFTSSSDVWSYGVVLWEMATLASQPYQGLSNDQVLRYVIDGGVMERPENCPDKLYTLMRYCWQPKPTSRPTFLKLCQLLLEDASSNFAQVSFYNSPAGVEARAARTTPSPSHTDDPAATPLRSSAERLQGYLPPNSQESDEMEIDTHHCFPSISEARVVLTATVGRWYRQYISGYPEHPAGLGLKINFIKYFRSYFDRSYFTPYYPYGGSPPPSSSSSQPSTSNSSSHTSDSTPSPGTETVEITPADSRKDSGDSQAGTSKCLPQILEVEEPQARMLRSLLNILDPNEPQPGTSKDFVQFIELEETQAGISKKLEQIVELEEGQAGTSKDLIQFIEDDEPQPETSKDLGQIVELKEAQAGILEDSVQIPEIKKTQTETSIDLGQIVELEEAQIRTSQYHEKITELEEAQEGISKDLVEIPEPKEAQTGTWKDSPQFIELEAQAETLKDLGQIVELEKAQTEISKDPVQIVELEEAQTIPLRDLVDIKEQEETQAGTSKDLVPIPELEKVQAETLKDLQIIEPEEAQAGTSKNVQFVGPEETESGTTKDLLQFIFMPEEKPEGALRHPLQFMKSKEEAQENSEELQLSKDEEDAQGTSEELQEFPKPKNESQEDLIQCLRHEKESKESQEVSECSRSSNQSLEDSESSEKETPASSELSKFSGISSQKDSESLEASTTDESPEEHPKIPTTEALI